MGKKQQKRDGQQPHTPESDTATGTAAAAAAPAPEPGKPKPKHTAAVTPHAKAAAAAAADAGTKGSSKQKRAAKDEIDEIFSSSKRKAGTQQQQQEQQKQQQQQPGLGPELQQVADAVQAARQASKRPKVEGSKDDIFGESAGKARKCTEEGFAIYGEDELGLGRKGGDTPLCPFDCDCCF